MPAQSVTSATAADIASTAGAIGGAKTSVTSYIIMESTQPVTSATGTDTTSNGGATGGCM